MSFLGFALSSLTRLAADLIPDVLLLDKVLFLGSRFRLAILDI
jgi:hypothetical protein